MLQLIAVLMVGLLAGQFAGWAMGSVVRVPRLDLATGAFGALGAVSLAWWGQVTGAHAPVTSLALGMTGAFVMIFVVHLALQAHRPGEWVALRALGSDVTAAVEPSLARTASRGNPLLVLHSGHALRCWPADDVKWSRSNGGPERQSWMVEVDGMVEHQGPSAGVGSTSAEVKDGVRSWWDDLQLTAAASRAGMPAHGSRA
jgi:hypothetical protein